MPLRPTYRRANADNAAARSDHRYRCRPHRHRRQRLILRGTLRHVGTCRRCRTHSLQAQPYAAARHLRHAYRGGIADGACTVRCRRARIHLFHPQPQVAVLASCRMALLRTARHGGYEPRRRSSDPIRRLYIVRQTQLQQQDQHMPVISCAVATRQPGHYALLPYAPTDSCATWSERSSARWSMWAAGAIRPEQFEDIIRSRDLSRSERRSPGTRAVSERYTLSRDAVRKSRPITPTGIMQRQIRAD